jgi:3-mercaptopyruvate sulfurtransferase SseA
VDPRFIPPILVSVILLVISGLILLGLSRPKQVYPVEALAAAAESAYPEIRRISLAEAKAAYENRQAVFLDVRDAISYKAGHIPGTLNIPLAELEKYIQDLNPQSWIITYCT